MVNNTKYGSGALQNNSGTNNTAVGAYTSYNNLDASNNTAIGSNSAFYTTTGSNNTSLGAGSLCNNTTGGLNTAIGSSALEGRLPIGSVGNQNTAIGAQALYMNQGNLNTSIGAFSALGLTGGSYNTFLGANTSATQPNFSYSTAIGYGATIDASNEIMMGGMGAGSYPNVIIPGNAFLPNFDIINVQSDQVVPKSYVDTVSQGLSPKGPVQAATTSTDGNIGTSYSLPAGTISGVSNSLTLDGVGIFDGSAVLIKNQTDATANGIYIYNVLGGGPSTSTLSRSSVLPVGSDAVGAFTFVQNGVENGGKLAIQNTPPATPGGPVIVGTDPLNFIEYFSFNYKLGEGLNFSTDSGVTYLNVDSSLNFINFLDSNSSAYTQPGGALASGTLALGTNTTNKIIIGPTGTSVPIQAQSIIEAQQGITGATGSFNYLAGNYLDIEGDIYTAGNLLVEGHINSTSLNISGDTTLYGNLIGTTGSFNYLSVGNIDAEGESIILYNGSYATGEFGIDVPPIAIGESFNVISNCTLTSIAMPVSTGTITISQTITCSIYNFTNPGSTPSTITLGTQIGTSVSVTLNTTDNYLTFNFLPQNLSLLSNQAYCFTVTNTSSSNLQSVSIFQKQGGEQSGGLASWRLNQVSSGSSSYTAVSNYSVTAIVTSQTGNTTINVNSNTIFTNPVTINSTLTTTGTITSGGLISAQSGITGPTGSFDYLIVGTGGGDSGAPNTTLDVSGNMLLVDSIDNTTSTEFGFSLGVVSTSAPNVSGVVNTSIAVLSQGYETAFVASRGNTFNSGANLKNFFAIYQDALNNGNYNPITRQSDQVLLTGNYGLGTADASGGIVICPWSHTASGARMDVSGNFTFYNPISAPQGITGATGSFNNLYVTNNAQFVQDISVNTLTIGLGGGQQSTNVAIGYQSLLENTTGAYNTSIGYQSLLENTTGGSNTAIGFQSLAKNTTGVYNTAIGSITLYNNTTGQSNTAIGNGVLQNNTTGQSNTAIGNGVLQNNTTGGYNTSTGDESLQSNTTGVYNTAIGFQSLITNTTGGNNTALGSITLYNNTTGVNNTAIGNGVLQNNTIGGNNTAIGYSAGGFTGTFSNSTAIGANSIFTSSNQIMLGGLNSGIYPQVVVPGGITGPTGSFSQLVASQSMYATNISGVTGIFSQGVSATNIGANNASITGTLSVTNISGATGSFTQGVTATTLDGNNANITGTLSVTTLSASTANITGTVSAAVFNTTSDYRIKENVIPLDDKFMVDSLIPVTYKNKLTEKQDIGLIAHEVQEIYPFLVNGVKDGENFQSVNYTSLIALLIKEIKELKQRVKVLEDK